MPIIKAPIRAPNPSEDAKTPILNSDNINFSLPNTGINETNGKPKILLVVDIRGLVDLHPCPLKKKEGGERRRGGGSAV